MRVCLCVKSITFDAADCESYRKIISLRQGIAHLNSVANFRRKGRDDLGGTLKIHRLRDAFEPGHSSVVESVRKVGCCEI